MEAAHTQSHLYLRQSGVDRVVAPENCVAQFARNLNQEVVVRYTPLDNLGRMSLLLEPPSIHTLPRLFPKPVKQEPSFAIAKLITSDYI
jgi:hypothetical protein